MTPTNTGALVETVEVQKVELAKIHQAILHALHLPGQPTNFSQAQVVLEAVYPFLRQHSEGKPAVEAQPDNFLEREDIEALLIAYDHALERNLGIGSIDSNVNIVRELLANTPKREPTAPRPAVEAQGVTGDRNICMIKDVSCDNKYVEFSIAEPKPQVSEAESVKANK